MTSPEALTCLCYWTGPPGQIWRHRTWTSLRTQLHRWRHAHARHPGDAH